MRVCELAVELGWTSQRLVSELCRRGEYVESAASALEAPFVRDIQRDFAAISDKPDCDATVAPEACVVQARPWIRVQCRWLPS